MNQRNLDKEAFEKINSHNGLTDYDKVLVREVLLKVFSMAYEGTELYEKEANFALGAKESLTHLMEFIQDELNEFECPRSTYRSKKRE